jgi:hypothetical protein
LLRIAGEVTWFTSPVATGGGLVVTLERWAFYAGGIEGATDDATGRATTPPVVPTTTEEEKKKARQAGKGTDPERARQVESLKLARVEMQRQLELTAHQGRKQQLTQAVAEIDKRIKQLS